MAMEMTTDATSTSITCSTGLGIFDTRLVAHQQDSTPRADPLDAVYHHVRQGDAEKREYDHIEVCRDRTDQSCLLL